MNWMKKNRSTIILVFIFFIGLSLLLYPTLSDYWNSFHQSKAIVNYAETVAQIDNSEYQEMWQVANEYNKNLIAKGQRFTLTEKELEEYNSILNVGGAGIIGYIEIPDINVSLPIYHGVDDVILQIAIGHLPGTSLPIGGESTHCAISGHRGLPSAKLFTNLDQLKEGDLFMMRVLDESYTYEVDQIRIVEPADLSALKIEEGKDYCTLITCTPYGVNSHRLLVRGHRVENVLNNSIMVVADATQIDSVLVAPMYAVPILVILFIGVLVRYRKR